MMRSTRVLLDGATVLSFLFCVTTAGLWVRSYWVTDVLSWRTVARGPFLVGDASASIRSGSLEYRRIRYDVAAAVGREERWVHSQIDHIPNRYEVAAVKGFDLLGLEPVHKYGALGFEVTSEQVISYRREPTRRYRWVTMPLYAPTLMLALLPVCRALAHRRRARRDVTARCTLCGYDLRATPERCPECGTVPAALSSDAPARSPADRSPPLD